MQPQAIFDVANQLMKLADEMRPNSIKATNENEFIFKGLTIFFFAKAFKAYKAILLLCQEGYCEDANILLRSLFEIVVNALYINQDQFKRARLYMEYDFIEREKVLEIIKKYHDEYFIKVAKERAGDEKELLKEYTRVKNNYPNKNKWSGLSIEAMAQKIGMNKDYDYLYRFLSQGSHCSPTTIKNYLQDTTQGIKVLFNQPFQHVESIIVPAITYFLRITDLKNKTFNLGYDKQIENCVNQLCAIRESV